MSVQTGTRINPDDVDIGQSFEATISSDATGEQFGDSGEVRKVWTNGRPILYLDGEQANYAVVLLDGRDGWVVFELDMSLDDITSGGPDSWSKEIENASFVGPLVDFDYGI